MTVRQEHALVQTHHSCTRFKLIDQTFAHERIWNEYCKLVIHTHNFGNLPSFYVTTHSGRQAKNQMSYTDTYQVHQMWHLNNDSIKRLGQ